MSSAPPLGLVPKFVRNKERAEEILDAMGRFVAAGKTVPREWIDEFTQLVGEEPSGSKAI